MKKRLQTLVAALYARSGRIYLRLGDGTAAPAVMLDQRAPSALSATSRRNLRESDYTADCGSSGAIP